MADPSPSPPTNSGMKTVFMLAMIVTITLIGVFVVTTMLNMLIHPDLALSDQLQYEDRGNVTIMTYNGVAYTSYDVYSTRDDRTGSYVVAHSDAGTNLTLHYGYYSRGGGVYVQEMPMPAGTPYVRTLTFPPWRI